MVKLLCLAGVLLILAWMVSGYIIMEIDGGKHGFRCGRWMTGSMSCGAVGVCMLTLCVILRVNGIA